MVVPEERDGKLEEDPNLGRDATPANVTTSTRCGGRKETLTRKVNTWSAVGNGFNLDVCCRGAICTIPTASNISV